jgi:Na+/H+ antiporter NhaD/arsenite permease-like protein
MPILSLLPALTAAPAERVPLPLWSVIPFVLLLVCIAVLPLVATHWWEHNKNRAKVSFGLAVPFLAWILWYVGAPAHTPLLHVAEEYVAFIALLGSLYVISGGIYVGGSLAGTPLSNAGILGIGAILANLMGTTGASMVLIRPLLRANKSRQNRAHIVVFFIFVVSNCGGLLTPFADPPLFLGFLKGVPFEWTLQLWKEWVLVCGALIVIFVFVDSYVLDREEKQRAGSQLEAVLEHEPMRIEGWHNLILLLGVVAVILGRGYGWGAPDGKWPVGLQELLMLALALAAWFSTKPRIRAANGFTFHPIAEVAILFAGIFATMVAPLQILNARGGELGLTEPWQFFWATGSLSAFLDNAPTYLAFASLAAGQAGISVDSQHYLGEFLALGHEWEVLLIAISCGSVMMGAMSYIGNGPNFMVKAIAEENGVKMPSFFGYMLWALAFLAPLLVVMTVFIFPHL